MRRPILPLAIFMLLMLPLQLSARIYIWTDAEGVKHYSQEPPPEGAAEVQVQDEMRYDPSADAKSHRGDAGSATGAPRTPNPAS